MRKPNYRFERAERDRAKEARNERSCSGSRNGRPPGPRTPPPNRPRRTSRAKPDRRPPVSRSAALISRIRLKKGGTGYEPPT
jgi:hypothetical protein